MIRGLFVAVLVGCLPFLLEQSSGSWLEDLARDVRFTPEFLQELGITPIRGRLFTAAEDEVDHPEAIVVLSERLWRRRFASDPDILGKSVRMDGRAITVIGIVNTDFQLFGDEWEFF